MVPKTTSGTREVAPDAGPLDPSEVTDERDTSPRAPKTEIQNAKYVKAYPARNATTLIIPANDFQEYGGIRHDDVTFDFRDNNFKVLVGQRLSHEAADFLTTRYPDTFKYVVGA